MVIDWDLIKLAEFPLPSGIRIEQAHNIQAAELTDFILHSYQPYWQWWMDEILEKPWLRTDYTGQDTSPVTATLGERHRSVLVAAIEHRDQTQQAWFYGYQGDQLIGVCDAKISADDNFNFGVLIRHEAGGTGVSSALMHAALQWLKDQGQTRARVITTSGMDDYDPTVYLYVQKLGGTIVAEYLDLVKKM